MTRVITRACAAYRAPGVDDLARVEGAGSAGAVDRTRSDFLCTDLALGSRKPGDVRGFGSGGPVGQRSRGRVAAPRLRQRSGAVMVSLRGSFLRNKQNNPLFDYQLAEPCAVARGTTATV